MGMEVKTLKFQVKFKVNERTLLKASGTCCFGLAGIEQGDDEPQGKSYTILFSCMGTGTALVLKTLSIIWFELMVVLLLWDRTPCGLVSRRCSLWLDSTRWTFVFNGCTTAGQYAPNKNCVFFWHLSNWL